MKKILLLASAVSAASASYAYADTSTYDGFYVGGGIYSVRQDWDDTNWHPIEILGGYKHSPFVGAEIRVGGFTGSSDPKLNNYESIYYRTESANSVGKTYLLLGYSRAEMGAYGDKYAFDGFSYGVGVGFVIGDKFNLNLEYKVLADGEGSVKQSDGSKINGLDMRISSIGATLDYRFGGSSSFLSNSRSRNSSPSASDDYNAASGGGFYVFGDLAYTQLSASSSDEDEPGITEYINGFSLGGGYKINKFFAVELAYRNLGELDESDEDFSTSLGFSAITLVGVASLPLGDAFSVYGRLGVSEITMDVDISDEEESESVSVSENKAVYGVGVRYALNDRAGLRFEVDQFAKWENLSLTSLKIGVDYSF